MLIILIMTLNKQKTCMWNFEEQNFFFKRKQC